MHKTKSPAQCEPAPPGRLHVDPIADLAAVLTRMMTQDPAERFQTSGEVARRPSSPDQARPLRTRSCPVLLTAVGVLFVMSTFAGVMHAAPPELASEPIDGPRYVRPRLPRFEGSIPEGRNESLHAACGQAAGVLHGQQEGITLWEKSAVGPIGSSNRIEAEPFSLALLQLQSGTAAQTNLDAGKDFRDLTEGLRQPSDLAKSRSFPSLRGSVSMRQGGTAVGLVTQQTAIRVSKETTRITKPLDDEGYVDYLQALNDLSAAGVTPENNYEVTVRSVLSPDKIPEGLRGEYFQRLGIPVPQRNRPFYRDFLSWRLPENADQREDARIRDEQEVLVSRPWRAAQHPEAAKWVAEQREHLDKLVQGSRRGKYYTPYLAAEPTDDEAFPRVLTTPLPSIRHQREIARSLATRAMGRIGEGDLNAAWSDLQAIHRVSQHVGRGPTLIEALVALAIDSMAFQGEVHVLNSPKLTPQQAKRFLDDLKSLRQLPSMADKIDVGERYLALDAVQTLARHVEEKGLFKMLQILQALSETTDREGVLPVAFQDDAGNQADRPADNGLDWNITLRLLNGWYDRLTTACREPNFHKRKALLAAINLDIKKLATETTDTKAVLKLLQQKGPKEAIATLIGKILVSLLLPAVDAVRSAEDGAKVRRDVVRLGLALKLHWLENGSLPETLDGLTPRYLKTIPQDPLSGAGLRYSVEDGRFLLYSVGRNGIDDLGRSEADATREPKPQPKWDDIVIRSLR